MKNWIDWLNTMIEFTVVAEFFFLFSATRVFRKKRVILYGVASLIFSSSARTLRHNSSSTGAEGIFPS